MVYTVLYLMLALSAFSFFTGVIAMETAKTRKALYEAAALLASGVLGATAAFVYLSIASSR